MNAINWSCYEQQCLASTLSLTDVRKKLFPTKSEIDRGPVLSEDKYTPKTLEGNWFEHRAVYIPQSDDWRSLYEIDYKSHVNKTWEINQNTKWNNKFNLERKWIPEQDLMKSFGTLTQFGLRDILKEEIYKNSKEGIAKCQWWSTYREEIGLLKPVNFERNIQFNRRKVNFNVPDLKHFKRKLSDIEQCLIPLKIQNSQSNAQDDKSKK
ncbi:hypothetical protein WH47_01331 [Habropoda laboriosa]|uniref:Uncharacterized protein n=1 Tax=Habropoda laboriosa TaxID=597456 RepID=A0A0L7R329_9HYME|nr:hypothetical protein WH47_01331 [Habropoda laboriosa]